MKSFTMCMFLASALLVSFGAQASTISHGLVEIKIPEQSGYTIKLGYPDMANAQNARNALNQVASSAKCGLNNYKSEIRTVDHDVAKYDKLIRDATLDSENFYSIQGNKLTRGKYYVYVMLRDLPNTECFNVINKMYWAGLDLYQKQNWDINGSPIFSLEEQTDSESNFMYDLGERAAPAGEYSKRLASGLNQQALEKCGEETYNAIPANKKYTYKNGQYAISCAVSKFEAWVCAYDPETGKPVVYTFFVIPNMDLSSFPACNR